MEMSNATENGAKARGRSSFLSGGQSGHKEVNMKSLNAVGIFSDGGTVELPGSTVEMVKRAATSYGVRSFRVPAPGTFTGVRRFVLLSGRWEELAPPTPEEEAELAFSLEANFEPGSTVVNILTGERHKVPGRRSR